MGIPVGISLGLAAGAVISKPARREPMSGASMLLRTWADDDSVPPLPRSPYPR